MDGQRLPYPHPDWKAWDFYKAESVTGPSEPYYTAVWKTRADSILPIVESDEVYVLNSLNVVPPLIGTRATIQLQPVPGYHQWERVGSDIFWKRIVLRLWLETNASTLFVQPEHLRVSLVYSEMYNQNPTWGNPSHYPARWQDVYLPSSVVDASDAYGTHSELNVANMRRCTVLKEWFFTDGAATHLDPLDNLNDIKDLTQVKTFVCAMDLPDLRHTYAKDSGGHPILGKGDLLLLVNSSAELDEGVVTSRFRLRFCGRLYFVDAQ